MKTDCNKLRAPSGNEMEKQIILESNIAYLLATVVMAIEQLIDDISQFLVYLYHPQRA